MGSFSLLSVFLLALALPLGFSEPRAECVFYYSPGPNRTGPLVDASLQWLVTATAVDTWTNYYGFDYYLSSTPATRSEAATSCAGMGNGAVLATINSEDENNFVFCLNTNIFQRFIGMKLSYPTPTELLQEWEDVQPVTYGKTTFRGGVGMPWRRREPNNLGGSEFCVSQGFSANSPFYPAPTSRWNDIECSRSLPYVCKRPTLGNSVPAYQGPTATTPSISTTPSKAPLRTQTPTAYVQPAPLPFCGTIPYAVDQWVDMPGTNYSYYTSYTRMTRYEAGMQCTARDAILASIHSADENRFIFCQNTAMTRWIGMDMKWMSRRRLEDQMWTDKTMVDFGKVTLARPYDHVQPDNLTEPWFPGQPDFYKHAEYCVVQGSFKGGMGVWHDVPCDIQRGYVCKKCIQGQTGVDCAATIDYCAGNQCVFGDCVSQPATEDYSCDCKAGAGLNTSTFAPENLALAASGFPADVGMRVWRTSAAEPTVSYYLIGGDIKPGNWQPDTNFPQWQESALSTPAMTYVAFNYAPIFSFNFTLYDETENFDYMFGIVVADSNFTEAGMLTKVLDNFVTHKIASVNNTAGIVSSVSVPFGSKYYVGLVTLDSLFGRATAKLDVTGFLAAGDKCDELG